MDDICRAFIARSPFVVVSSSDSAGNLDVFPKGDPAGFVHVLDDRTIAIPERPGDRRADTFRNVLQNPKVGLIFVVPDRGETLGISGSARIVRDAWLREQMKVADRMPELALVVTRGGGLLSLLQVHGSIAAVEAGNVEFRRARLLRGSHGRPPAS